MKSKRSLLKAVCLFLCAVTLLSALFSCNNGQTEETGTKTETEAETYAETTEEVTETEKIKKDKYDYDTVIYPAPRTVKYDESKRGVNVDALNVPDEYAASFTKFGFDISGDGLDVKVEQDASLCDEEYKIEVDENGVKIAASGSSGVFYAANTLGQLYVDGMLPYVSVTDSPDVPYRGVIEGFYGVAWTHKFRLDLMDYMGKCKMNTYIYAPKDDPKHRAQWREAYTKNELARLSEFINRAIENNVKFVYAISPGLDMDLGNGYEKDLEKLFNKCRSVYDLGVRNFAVLLDDIPTLDAEGHAKLLNDFQTRFVETHDGTEDLIVITPEFCNALMTNYTKKLAPLLNEKLIMMWTGYYVLPATITNSDLKKVTETFGRKLLIWWNYPVNDTMADNLFLGPCESLANDLTDSICGITANPMNQGYASLLPLYTTADYLWNMKGYDKDTSIVTAARCLMPDCADALLAFEDLMSASAINGNVSTRSVADYVKTYNSGSATEADYDMATDKLTRILSLLSDLEEKGDKNFYSDAKRWIRKAKGTVEAALALFRLELAVLKDKDMPQSDRMAIAADYINAKNSIKTNSAIVSPDVLSPLVENSSRRIYELVSVPYLLQTYKDVKPSTNLQTYADYYLTYATDNNDGTFFWSAGSPASGAYVCLELKQTEHITGVVLNMATAQSPDDYIQSGRIEYSTDGKTWHNLQSLDGRENYFNADINAKYVRAISSKAQVNWIIVREFGVIVDGGKNTEHKVTLTPAKSVSTAALTDGDIFTAFKGDKGSTVSVNVGGAKSVSVYFASLHDDGATVYLQKENGEKSKEVKASYVTTLDTSGYDKVCVSFAASDITVAEIAFIEG